MKSIRGFRSLLTVLGLFVFFPAPSDASVMCGVFEGTGCETPLYYMKLCADITLRQGYCERLCAQQEPICNVEDFSPWVQAYEDIGRRGIRGELQNHANEFDEAGTLMYLSEKTVTACKKSRSGGWTPFKGPKVCPKAKAASASACRAGTLHNTTTNTCVVQNSSGASGTVDYQNLMGQSNMLVATQNQHFGNNPSTDTDLTFSAVTAQVDKPGLTQATDVDSSVNLPSFQTSTFSGAEKKNFRNSVAGSDSAGAAAALAPTTNAIKDAAKGDQVYAAADTSAKDSYRAVGKGAGSDTTSGTSWFGNSGAATPGSASGEVGFKGDAKASRGGNSSGDVLVVEDPANYFMMSDMDMSLFKRVTAQCRRKEKELVPTPGI